MKYICAVLLLFLALQSSGQRIDAMIEASSANGLEIFHVYQSSQSRKMSINQVKTFVWDLSPTITTSDTIGFVLVRRTSDGKIFKRSVSSIRHIFEDEGTPVAQRRNINFTGPGVSVTDTGGKTVVEINAVGGGGGASGSNILDVNTTQVGNVGAGEDLIYSYTLPGDTLDVDEDGLNIRLAGSFTPGNSKTLKVKVDGQLIVNFAGTFAAQWTIDCEVIRVSSTSVKANCIIVGASAGVTHSTLETLTGLDLTNDLDITATAEGTSDDDIIKESATVTTLECGGSGGVGGGDVSLADFIASETPTGAVNGVNDTYTLANTPTFLHVYLDGLLQEEGPGNDYTISGTTITMVTPPLTGSKVRASYIK